MKDRPSLPHVIRRSPPRPMEACPISILNTLASVRTYCREPCFRELEPDCRLVTQARRASDRGVIPRDALGDASQAGDYRRSTPATLG